MEFSTKYPDSQRHQKIHHALEARISKYQTHIATYKTHLEKARNLRLIVGLITSGSCFLFMLKPEYKWAGIAFLGLSPAFVLFMKSTRNYSRFLANLEKRHNFLKRQLEKLLGLPLSRPPIPHSSTDDIQLFGNPSVFELTNECFSQEGAQRLAHQITSGLQSKESIILEQENVKYLAKFPGCCERLLVSGASKEDDFISMGELKEAFSTPIVDQKYFLWGIGHAILFPVYLYFFYQIASGKIAGYPLSLPVILYAIFSLSSLKSILASFRNAEILERSLGRMTFIIDYLQNHKKVFERSIPELQGDRFSFGPLKLYVSGLSIQSHGLAYLIVNGLMPWSFIFSGLANRWRAHNSEKFLSLMSDLEKLEVSLSFANIYRYQTQCFPEFSGEFELKVTAAYHPLIPRESVVANSVDLSKDQSLILLTGSNMAGKSTFMRTLAVNQTLAMAGAPVFAKGFQTFFAPVFTCLQIKDSLADGYSYFYSEVRKIKELIEKLKENEYLFFFIDEIFKGTNNKERFVGSQSVIKELSELPNARGIVSTHDLELASLSDSSPSLHNFHFRDSVGSGGLEFSYELKTGPCPTTNALKIMAREGLPVPTE